MKTVLYFQTRTKTSAAAEKLIGVREIADRLDWHIQVIDSAVTDERLRQLRDFWHPDGLIVECGERTTPFRVFDGYKSAPVVFIDRAPDTLPPRGFCVIHDSTSAGEAAARELMMTGFTNFAFVPFPGKWRWNDERKDGFSAALELNGLSCLAFSSKARDIASPAYARDLRKFLLTLPRPCAVFVANDHPAERVIAEAAFLGLSIPDELAVLGVDDYTPICEHTAPPLSSVKPDFRRGGNIAALLLAAAIRDRRRFHGPRIRKYGTQLIVRRKSTQVRFSSGNPEVDAARALIRDRACSGLTAEAVMRTFGCSRTLAAARFRAATGHSILAEIHAVQLERVKEMLADPDRMLKTIADFCGFRSQNSLRKFFLRETGLTMSVWRERHQ